MSGENEHTGAGDDARDLIPADDRAEPVHETRQPQEAPARAEEDAPREIKQGNPYDEKRNSIVDKLRAQRDQNDKNPSIDIPPDMERQQVGPHVATREDRNRVPAAQVVEDLKPENIPAPRRITLKVNGEDRELDEEQVRGLAQRALASEGILDDAKRERQAARDELAEIRRLRADHSATQQPQPTPTPVKAEDTKPASDEELDDIIDAIQTGDVADAKKALSKYGDQIERRMMDKIGDIDSRIAATTQRLNDDARVKQETDRTINDFLAENDDFGSSDMRAKILIEETVVVMEENLKAIGVTDEQIQRISQQYRVAPQVAIGKATRMLREKGYDLPDSAAVMRTAAGRVRQGLGLPDPSVRPAPVPAVDPTPSILAERDARKQAMAPQPRRANISPGAETATTKSQQERRVDAVAHMRAYRRGR